MSDWGVMVIGGGGSPRSRPHVSYEISLYPSNATKEDWPLATVFAIRTVNHIATVNDIFGMPPNWELL